MIPINWIEPSARLSLMTDGGVNLSYKDMTDGQTIGYVH